MNFKGHFFSGTPCIYTSSFVWKKATFRVRVFLYCLRQSILSLHEIYVWRIDVSLHQILRMCGTSWISVEGPYFRPRWKQCRLVTAQDSCSDKTPNLEWHHLFGRNSRQLILFVVCSIMILTTLRRQQLDSQNSNLCYLGSKFNTSFPNMWHKTPLSSVHDKNYRIV